MEDVMNVLTVCCFALVTAVVVAQAGGGPEPASLAQLIQILLDFLSELGFLFDILFGEILLFG